MLFTTFVVSALGCVEHSGVEPIIQRGIRYIAHQMELEGLWRFWDCDDPSHDAVGPDLDDTALASAALTMHGMPVPDNLETLFRSRDAHGAFYTWPDPAAMSRQIRWYINWLKWLRGMSLQDPNDVDCAVNANVLWYLALRGREAPEACGYVHRCVAERTIPRASLYYPSRIAILYMITRAYLAGARGLTPSVEAIRDWLLELQRPDGSWGNDFETACAVASLLHLGYRGAPLDRGVMVVRERQQANGSWRLARLVEFYHMTDTVPTAISLEALARYLSARGLCTAEPLQAVTLVRTE